MGNKYLTLACICFIFWIPSNLFAQRNFRPGYIISLKKDTIYGLIDYRTDRLNAQSCTFRKNEDAEPRIYFPGDILGYRFTEDGKYYVSHLIEMKKGKPEELVFLECLLQSANSLYFFKDDTENGTYYLENEGKLVKLNRHKREKEVNNLYPKNMRASLPALNYFFNRFPDLQTEYNNAPFTRNKVIELVKAYNDKICYKPQECILFQAEKKQRHLNVELTPYVGITQCKFAKNSYVERQMDIKLSYLTGINLALSSSRFMSSFALSIDLSVSRLKIFYPEEKDFYSGTSLIGKIGIRYRYPSKIGIRPLIEVGILSQGTLFPGESSMGNTHAINNQITPGIYANAGAQIRLTKNWKHSLDFRGQWGKTKDCIDRETMSKMWSGYIGYSYLF